MHFQIQYIYRISNRKNIFNINSYEQEGHEKEIIKLILTGSDLAESLR